jgi:hypothetical protein
MGWAPAETSSVATLVDGGKVGSEFVGVEDDCACEEVERPEEIIDRDTKVRDDRIRSDVGLDVL